MADEQKTINWQKEEKELKTGSENFWKPKQGMNQIVFLDNGTITKGLNFDKKECEKIRFQISVNKEVKTWEVKRCDKGTQPTENSLYGQIAKFASAKGGLTGQVVWLNVTGQEQQTRYTLINPTALTKTN